jgi:hypothetical protein
VPQFSILEDPALPLLLGNGRHHVYLTRAGGSRLDAMRLYTWNIAVAGALWGGFHVLEISLRNALHARLSVLAGREDWWNSITLHTLERRKIDAAVRSVAREKGSRATPGHVVAELTFGFWVALLANRYHQRLWATTIEAAFPHLQGTRRALHAKLERLRMLRNRVAHHEPVFARDLSADHALILEVLDSIDPTVKRWVREYSRVPHLLECRDDIVAGYWPMTF